MRMRLTGALRAAWGVASALALVSCAGIRLVSDYDVTTDQQVTALQRAVDDTLVALKGATAPGCFYVSHVQFYQTTRSAVQSLRLRNEARGPKNTQTTSELGELSTALQAFEQLHQNASGGTPPACMAADRIELDRSGINAIFRAILTLELAKKRNDATASH